MVDFITRIWSGENIGQWRTRDGSGCCWSLNRAFSLLAKFESIGQKIFPSGLMYLVVLVFRSNMMETRVYNELNVIVTVRTLCFESQAYL